MKINKILEEKMDSYSKSLSELNKKNQELKSKLYDVEVKLGHKVAEKSEIPTESELKSMLNPSASPFLLNAYKEGNALQGRALSTKKIAALLNNLLGEPTAYRMW